MSVSNMEHTYDEAYAMAPDTAAADKPVIKNQVHKCRISLIVINLLIISLVVSAAAIVFAFVLFNELQSYLEVRFTNMESTIKDLSAKIEMDEEKLKRLEADYSELSVNQQMLTESLQNILVDLQELPKSFTSELNETIEDLQATQQNQLMQFLQAFSDEITSKLNVTQSESREELKEAVEGPQRQMESLQSLFEEASSKTRVSLNETRQELQASVDTQQELTESLQTLSDEVISYHQVETAISCPSDYIHNPYANSCIRLVTLTRSWYSAKSDCESSGERLATFETLESQYWFITLRKTDWRRDHVWVGGEKFSAGVWRWDDVTPKPLKLAVWGPEEPNSNDNDVCMESRDEEQYQFNDASCGDRYWYICERST